MKTFCLSIFGAVFLLAPQLNAAVIVQWDFENNLNDSSGNALNMSGGAGFSYSGTVPGTVINPGAISDTASYVPGPKPTPISLAANTLMTDTFSRGSFTLQTFVYLTAATNFQTILWNESGSTGSYFSVGGSSSYFDSYNGTGLLSSKTVGTGLSLNTWHHVAWVGTYTGGNGTLVQYYEDGAAVGSGLFLNQAASGAAPRAHIAPSTKDWQIGGTAGNQFAGRIDMLQLNNTALTPAQFNVAVPEPGTLVSLALGCGLLLIRRACRRNS